MKFSYVTENVNIILGSSSSGDILFTDKTQMSGYIGQLVQNLDCTYVANDKEQH